MLKEKQIRILMLVCDLEKTLGDIYTQFSGKFPEHNDLWELLIKEELEHAEATRELYRLTFEGKSLFDEGGIKEDAVQSILDYLRVVHDNARRGRYSLKKAVEITCEVEETIIERDFFTHFKVSPEYAQMLKTLDEGTRAHASLARKKLESLTQ